ncbi:histidine kinase [Fluviicola taffensis]|uniref:sensor histidine kinase n=1 Tax=Fluviicola taffensis TaxID=191579 RepID=UPI0031380DD6
MKITQFIGILSLCLLSFTVKGHEIDGLLQKVAKVSVEREKIELWEKIINLSIWQKSETETKNYIDRLYRYSKQKKNQYGMATADLLYAKYYERQQEMDKAKKYAGLAYEYFSLKNDRLGMCKTLRQQGFNAFKTSNNELATKLAYKALNISILIKNKTQEGLCMSQLGMIVFGTQPMEGIKLQKQGFEMLVKAGAKREASMTAITLSTLYLNSNENVMSQKYIDTFFVLQQGLNDAGLLAQGTTNAALLAQGLGKLDQAEKLIEESGKYFSQIKSVAVQAQFYRIKSVFYRDSNRFPEAIEAAKKGLSLLENKQGLDSEKGMLQYTLFIAYKGLKQYEQAIEAYEQAVNAEFVVYDQQTQYGIANLKEKYETDKKEQENKELKQVNEINQLKLSTNRYFIIGIVLLSLLLVVVFVLVIRNNRIKAREKNIHLQQKLLISQMNPHFIFNSLNSIQNFIYKQDPMKAATYLSRFSELMRMILTFSRKDQVTLAEEKHLLERYLEIQKLRFGDKLEWEISSSDDIDDENVLIQPMLSQPFIENSLEHGLFKDNQVGKISIRFAKEADYLLFEIEDNGVGLNNLLKKHEGHESLATTITEERIAGIRTLGGTNTTFEVINLSDINEELQGVKVLFKIPYQTLL